MDQSKNVQFRGDEGIKIAYAVFENLVLAFKQLIFSQKKYILLSA